MVHTSNNLKLSWAFKHAFRSFWWYSEILRRTVFRIDIISSWGKAISILLTFRSHYYNVLVHIIIMFLMKFIYFPISMSTFLWLSQLARYQSERLSSFKIPVMNFFVYTFNRGAQKSFISHTRAESVFYRWGKTWGCLGDFWHQFQTQRAKIHWYRSVKFLGYWTFLWVSAIFGVYAT